MTTEQTPAALKKSRKAPPKHFVHVIGSALVLGFLILLLWRYIFITILPGHVGVLYSWFFGGTQISAVYGEGLAMKLPWNRIYIFETRTQARTDEIATLSSEGMEVSISLSSLFNVRPEAAGRLLKKVGPDYEKRVVFPLVTGAMREVISRYNSVELYTSDYKKLETEVHQIVQNSRYSDMIDFTNLIIREIRIPKTISQAIDAKLAQEQLAASYTFKLESERQEAERKRIRALGIQNFYSIVSDALNVNLLTWRGIEATVELARSPNSKVVIVGSGKDQLPLILGSDIHKLPPPPRVKALTDENAPALNVDKLPELFPSDDSSTRGLSDSALGVTGDGTDPEPTPNKPSTPTSKKPAPQTTPAPVNEQTDGLIAPKGDEVGLTNTPYDTSGVRKLPLEFLNETTPESSPYGIKSE